MIISDLNYLETVAEASHIEGAATAATAATETVAVGLFGAVATKASTRSSQGFFFNQSSARTAGRGIVFVGGVSSTSVAASAAG